MREEIEKLIGSVTPPDREALARAKARQAKLAKPIGSLGKLEDIAVRLAGITGRTVNAIRCPRILVFAADNGILEEGVSSAPRSVTASQAVNMTFARTGMSSMAAYFGDEVLVVDVGIADAYDCPAILDRKIAPGTRNFLKGPAMTREQAEEALLTGAQLARAAAREGVDVLGIGEMGIGNTSTSTAVLCALTGADPETVTGKGGGITDAVLLHKKEVIRRALALHGGQPEDPVGILSRVGGFDLCAMTGAFLGAASVRLPVVVDGFISAVAALCAARMCPAAAEYFFPSHVSQEPGYLLAVRELGLDPWLHLEMRLGEGSGCPIAFRVMQAACAVMSGMALFGEEAGIDDSYLEELRESGEFER